MCHPWQACDNHAQGHPTFPPHPWREVGLVSGGLGKGLYGDCGAGWRDEGDWQGGMCVMVM